MSKKRGDKALGLRQKGPGVPQAPANAANASAPKHSMFPGTAKTLLSAVPHGTDGRSFRIVGQIPTDVTIVGKVASIEPSDDPTCLAFKITDETGQILAKIFGDHDMSLSPDPNVQPDKLVRVFGCIRSDKNGLFVYAYMAKEASDDELKFHLAEAELHRRRLQGALFPPNNPLPPNNQTKNPTAKTIPATANPATANPTTTNSQTINSSGKNLGAKGGFEAKEASEAAEASAAHEKAVLAALEHGRSSDIGMTIDEICRHAPTLPAAAVRASIDALLKDGHVFPAIDDDHFVSSPPKV